MNAFNSGPQPSAPLLTLDPDRLRVHKRVRAEMREFSTVTAVFEAADRNTWIGSSNAIHEHSTRIPVTCNPAGKLDIRGPEIPAQPELARVRGVDGCINVPYAGYRGNRAEGLFIKCRHALGHST